MTRENIIKQLKRLIPSLQYADDVNAVKGAIKALSQEPCDDAVSRGVFEQVMWERDIAIEQLHELGYELGQKIEPCTDTVSREAVLDEAFEVDTKEYGRIEVVGVDAIDALPPVTPSRHVNCKIAEHDGNGCLGYSHYGDDFPIEECLHCPKYTSYEEE